MHEFGIVSALFDEIERQAAAAGMAKVSRVEVAVGHLRQVVPEVLRTAWTSVTRQTFAEGAALDIEPIAASARCRHCGVTYEPDLHDFRCAGCGRADAEILAGDEILLKSVSGEAMEKSGSRT